MGSLSSRHPSPAARAWLAFAVVAATAGFAVGGCGEEESEAPPAEIEADAVAGDPQPSAAQAGESGEPQAPATPGQQAAESRERLNQRAERTRERIDAIQRIAAQVRASDPATLEALAERLRENPADQSESPEDLCRRLGGPDRICEAL